LQTFEEHQEELAVLECQYPAFADWLAKWDIRAETAQETLDPQLAPYFPSYGVVNAGADSTIPLEGIIYLSLGPSSPRMGVDWLEIAPWNRGTDRQLWQVADLLMGQALRLFLDDKSRNIFCGVATTPEAVKFDTRIGLSRAQEMQIRQFMPYSIFSRAVERWANPAIGFRPAFFYATREQAAQILEKIGG
jgi:hypothetical protein